MKKAGDLLSTFLDKMGINDTNNYSGLFSAWKKIAGPQLEVHSRIADIRKGILFVEVDHPGWMQRIQMNQKAILQAIHKSFPQLGIQDIAYRLVDSFERKKTVEEPRQEPEEIQTEGEESCETDMKAGKVLPQDKSFIDAMNSLRAAMKSNPKLGKSRKSD